MAKARVSGARKYTLLLGDPGKDVGTSFSSKEIKSDGQ